MPKEVVALTFPGGKRLQHTIPATAGNVVYNYSPDTLKRVLLIRGRIELTTDATVANRRFGIMIYDGTNRISDLGASSQITASTTKGLSIGEARSSDGTTLSDWDVGYGDIYLAISPILLEGADQLRITIIGGQAGDSYSGFLVMREI